MHTEDSDNKITIHQLFETAESHLDRNSLEDAIVTYQEISRLDPGNDDAWTALGTIFGELCDIRLALDCLHKSLNISPERADTHLQLAKVLQLAGKPLQALDHLHSTIKSDPECREAYERLGLIYLSCNQLDKSVQSFNRVVDIYSADALLHYRIGSCYLQYGHADLALPHLEAATRLKPGFYVAYTNIGYIHRVNGEISRALENYLHALHDAPDNPVILHNYGLALQDAGRFDEAVECHYRAVLINNSYKEAYQGLGSAYLASGRYEQAISPLKKAILIDPGFAGALHALGNTYSALGRHEEAEAVLRKAAELRPGIIEICISLSAALLSMGRPVEALEHLERALSTQPDHAGALALKATILKRQGDSRGAYDTISEYVNNKTAPSIALAYSTLCSDFNQESAAIEILADVLDNTSSLSSGMKRKLHFALGRLLDSVSEYDDAYKHYSTGNALRKASFNQQHHGQLINKLSTLYTTDFTVAMPRSRTVRNTPVFIVGIPRSGTTLVEQILASHPRVLGAGELPHIPGIVDSLPAYTGTDIRYPDCIYSLSTQLLEQLTRHYLSLGPALPPGKDFFTDKLPNNFLYLGLIEQLFPGARIIHCIREPLDTCLSCYFQDFARSHPYCYRLEDIGYYYRSYIQLMRHWKNVLSLSILDVQYEAIVNSVETEIPKLLEFCELEWSHRCLEFFKNDRYVGTASHDQVSKPLYKKSINRWKNYEKHLQPLIKALEG